MSQAITVRFPDGLYERVKREAERARRSLEEEVLDGVASALPDQPALAPDLARAVGDLAVLDDAALVRAARSHLPLRAARRMEALHLKSQREGLNSTEDEELAGLVRRYERALLVRAHAARLLQQRGHRLELPGLILTPSP